MHLLGDPVASDRPVTPENVLTYVRLVAQYRLIVCVQRQLDVSISDFILWFFYCTGILLLVYDIYIITAGTFIRVLVLTLYCTNTRTVQ